MYNIKLKINNGWLFRNSESPLRRPLDLFVGAWRNDSYKIVAAQNFLNDHVRTWRKNPLIIIENLRMPIFNFQKELNLLKPVDR